MNTKNKSQPRSTASLLLGSVPVCCHFWGCEKRLIFVPVCSGAQQRLICSSQTPEMLGPQCRGETEVAGAEGELLPAAVQILSSAVGDTVAINPWMRSERAEREAEWQAGRCRWGAGCCLHPSSAFLRLGHKTLGVEGMVPGWEQDLLSLLENSEPRAQAIGKCMS